MRRELIILSGLFQTAIHEWGYANLINPVRGVKMPADSPRRTRRLNQCEKDLLLTHAKLNGPRYLFISIFLALKTGMRQSEIIGLRKSDIDFERSLIELRDTKNGEPRLVPLTQSVLRELRRFYYSDEVVFPVTRSGLQNAFRKTLRRLDIKNLRFHDLRHEAISAFFEQGLSMPEVQLLSGHKTVEQLMRYSHAKIANVRQKLEETESIEKPNVTTNNARKVQAIW
ncbi:MAG: site-specific integrase [Alphaproteobacteria bacterium]|nr:site-specific integrase [Alphaproteobacteria bacterium]